ncbi:shikimate kinase AroL [soil metagenome]
MNRIILVGPRGSGKSTVGPLLAAKLGWTFVDADVVLETNISMSIAELFTAKGEGHFRDLETATLQSLLTRSEIVLATGGGIVGREVNREQLKTEFVAWLDLPAEAAYERMQADPTTTSRRPNLTATGGIDEMRTLIERRQPLYTEVATVRVDAADSPERVADRILQAWQSNASAMRR